MTRLLSIIESRRVIELQTSCICPPIPTRSYDWSALDANTYDMTGIDGETMQPYSTCPVGYGETEADAISSLFDSIELQEAA